MNEADAQAFKCLLDKVGAYYEHVIANPDVWWQALEPYPLEVVKGAFDGWVRSDKGDYPPKPINILRQILSLSSQDDRPGPEEAWSIALQAMDEAATVVWTQEMATAYGVARSILEAGDEVGARMAFREVYARKVAAVRAEGVPLKWIKSLGYVEGGVANAWLQNATMRDSALEDAAQRLQLPQLTEAARLEYERYQGPAENMREHIAEIKRILTVTVGETQRRDHIQVIIDGLPEDRKERQAAIERLDGQTRRKVKHVLGEIERVRQLEGNFSKSRGREVDRGCASVAQ